MSQKNDNTMKIHSEAARLHIRQACAAELEEIVILQQQLSALIYKQTTILKKIEDHTNRVMGILRTEIRHSFSR